MQGLAVHLLLMLQNSSTIKVVLQDEDDSIVTTLMMQQDCDMVLQHPIMLVPSLIQLHHKLAAVWQTDLYSRVY
jgi:hypothetical protein